MLLSLEARKNIKEPINFHYLFDSPSSTHFHFKPYPIYLYFHPQSFCCVQTSPYTSSDFMNSCWIAIFNVFGEKISIVHQSSYIKSIRSNLELIKFVGNVGKEKKTMEYQGGKLTFFFFKTENQSSLFSLIQFNSLHLHHDT